MIKKFAKGGSYFEVYQKVFAFHKKHAGVSSDEDWAQLAEAAKAFVGEFEVKLAVAAVDEIERAYLSKGNM